MKNHILDKIKKLQALAGNNSNEAEATAAAETAFGDGVQVTITKDTIEIEEYNHD